jgi:predicted metalloprotease
MRWRSGRRSTNVEDRRGRRVSRAGKFTVGGGAGLILILAVLLLGGDPSEFLNVAEEAPAPSAGAAVGNDEEAEFISVVLGYTEETWSQLFAARGARYEPPTLVLFTDAVQSACGFAGAATGPFYCPADRKIYIDLGFFRELERLGGPGDFARAYVLGHEVAHHVQNLAGTSTQVRQLQSRANTSQANALSVMLELQADCYAGVWAHHTEQRFRVLEPGDVEEGLGAAAAIGDDRLQRMSRGRVQPESFTHGSSAQRVDWLRTGLSSGDLEACNTFERL